MPQKGRIVIVSQYLDWYASSNPGDLSKAKKERYLNRECSRTTTSRTQARTDNAPRSVLRALVYEFKSGSLEHSPSTIFNVEAECLNYVEKSYHPTERKVTTPFCGHLGWFRINLANNLSPVPLLASQLRKKVLYGST